MIIGSLNYCNLSRSHVYTLNITCILILSFINRCIICELYLRRTNISVTLFCPINNLLSAFTPWNCCWWWNCWWINKWNLNKHLKHANIPSNIHSHITNHKSYEIDWNSHIQGRNIHIHEFRIKAGTTQLNHCRNSPELWIQTMNEAKTFDWIMNINNYGVEISRLHIYE